MGGLICSVRFRIKKGASDLINLWPRVSDVNQVEQSSAPRNVAVASDMAHLLDDASMAVERAHIWGLLGPGIVMDPLITKRINFS